MGPGKLKLTRCGGRTPGSDWDGWLPGAGYWELKVLSGTSLRNVFVIFSIILQNNNRRSSIEPNVLIQLKHEFQLQFLFSNGILIDSVGRRRHIWGRLGFYHFRIWVLYLLGLLHCLCADVCSATNWVGWLIMVIQTLCANNKQIISSSTSQRKQFKILNLILTSKLQVWICENVVNYLDINFLRPNLAADDEYGCCCSCSAYKLAYVLT